MNNRQTSLRMMIVSAMFAAIIGVLAQLHIPLPLVPITGQTLAIGLAATILGSRYGTLSVLIYLFIGSVGIPVFAEASGGIHHIFGPTGGYLIGFIPTAFIIGYYVEKTSFTVVQATVANLIGMIITLVIGTAWLKIAASLSWSAAILAGFTPFLVVGVIKGVLAAWIGIIVRKRLLSAKLIPSNERGVAA